MLYHLFDYLERTMHFPGAGLFQYTSFRAILAAGVALFLSICLGKHFIALLKRKNISETQRDEKTDPFNTQKKGVPTMGGIVIIAAILLAVLLIGNLRNVYLILMIITTLILGLIGFMDDYIKTFRKNKDGLNGWWKIIGQVTLGLIVGLTLRYSPMVTMNERVTTKIENNTEVVVKSPAIKSTRTTVLFVKDHNANYADLFSFLGEDGKYKAGWICFVLMTILVVAAVSNGSNLNDGMDGMCAGNSAIIGIALIVLAYVSGNYILADYFDVMYIPHSEELVVFLAAFVGALIGFLWYNAFPAQVFMGDTGSLTIGGIIAVSAVIMHKELLLPILCGVFLIESVSVILQRGYFKLGKRKGVHQRLWKRTPIHDHFRTSMAQVHNTDPTSTVIFKGGKDLFHEHKIVLRFCIVTIILAAFTILTLKIR